MEAGVRHTTADVTAAALRGACDRVADWSVVTGPELLRGCRSRPVLDCLRRGLRTWLGAAEAHRRWPELFRRPNARPVPSPASATANPKTPTVEGVLPPAVLARPPTDPVRRVCERLYTRLLRRGGMRTTATLRAALSFLYGFLFATPHSLVPPDATVLQLADEEALVSHLHALDHATVVRAYTAYRDAATRLRPGLSVTEILITPKTNALFVCPADGPQCSVLPAAPPIRPVL